MCSKIRCDGYYSKLFGNSTGRSASKTSCSMVAGAGWLAGDLKAARRFLSCKDADARAQRQQQGVAPNGKLEKAFRPSLCCDAHCSKQAAPNGGQRACSTPRASKYARTAPRGALLPVCLLPVAARGRSCKSLGIPLPCARWFCHYPRLWPSFQLDSIIQKIST